MRWLTFLLAFGFALPLAAINDHAQFTAPPPGATLPVTLDKALKAGRLSPGQSLVTTLSQRVPVSSNAYLPAKAKLTGKIVAAGPTSGSVLFTELRWKGQSIPVHVKLVAAASAHNAYATELPIGGTDRGTADPADYTTRQVGGDVVYLSAGAGKVYNSISEPVGYANWSGVCADPGSTDALPRAMGPFSTMATGLHGLPDFSIVSDGSDGAPITLDAKNSKWKIDQGGALLLEVQH